MSMCSIVSRRNSDLSAIAISQKKKAAAARYGAPTKSSAPAIADRGGFMPGIMRRAPRSSQGFH
jgi:hypothetical protein